MLSQGRVPQVTELIAAAAICLTTQDWIDGWNQGYRTALADLTRHLHEINNRLGYQAVWADPIEGGWYLPLRLSRRLLPAATSSTDAFAALLHYGGDDRATGIGALPGELFGHRVDPQADPGDRSSAPGPSQISTRSLPTPGTEEPPRRAVPETSPALGTLLKNYM